MVGRKVRSRAGYRAGYRAAICAREWRLRLEHLERWSQGYRATVCGVKGVCSQRIVPKNVSCGGLGLGLGGAAGVDFTSYAPNLQLQPLTARHVLYEHPPVFFMPNPAPPTSEPNGIYQSAVTWDGHILSLPVSATNFVTSSATTFCTHAHARQHSKCETSRHYLPVSIQNFSSQHSRSISAIPKKTCCSRRLM